MTTTKKRHSQKCNNKRAKNIQDKIKTQFDNSDVIHYIYAISVWLYTNISLTITLCTLNSSWKIKKLQIIKITKLIIICK